MSNKNLAYHGYNLNLKISATYFIYSTVKRDTLISTLLAEKIVFVSILTYYENT